MDVNQRQVGKYAICIRLSNGKTAPLPVKIYAEDEKDDWIYQYALIYCDKLTAGFESEDKFIEYLKNKLNNKYDIAGVFLGRKEYIVDENGNRVKDSNGKDKYTYKEDAANLVFNNQVLKENASVYASKKEKQKGMTSAPIIEFVNENTYEIRSFIDTFLKTGYKEFMKDEYVMRALGNRSQANLNRLDTAIRNNTTDYAYISSAIRSTILSNYALFRYMYLKTPVLQKEIIEPVKEEVKPQAIEKVESEVKETKTFEQIVEEKIKMPVQDEDTGKIINPSAVLTSATALSLSKEEVEKRSSQIQNLELRGYYYGSGGISELCVAAMGYAIRDVSESDLEICGITQDMIKNIIGDEPRGKR